ncbi:MAG TPA: PIG-L family deacetylase [Gemmataceae bacterium]|nr:PIG-L family deacetylase [Gemmataceae bacterium]
MATYEVNGQPSDVASAAAILQELRSFKELGTVLHVAAHPDDENTTLITYLARGRGSRTAYLSMTRGDGGQNVIGPEFGEELGVIRTQELLAARRLDGGQQFFTRAKDFGFSKDVNETLKNWDRRQVVEDIVRVYRFFRPDVVVTRFTPKTGGHGHHTASAVLALEAFGLSGDAKQFPDQLKDLTVWQPKRIVSNGGGQLSLNVGGTDPVLGKSFGDIAGRSRGQHKSQGFGVGGGKGGGAKSETFSLMRGDPAKSDIFEGVDTTWGRYGQPEVVKLIDKAIATFNPKDTAASLSILLDIRKRIAALPADPLVTAKRQQLDRIIVDCLGISVLTTLPQAEVVAGELLSMTHAVAQRHGTGVRWIGVRYPTLKKEMNRPIELAARPEAIATVDKQQLPASTPLSQPYWLRQEGPPGMFRVDEASLIGQAENPPPFPVEYIFEVGGQTIVIPDEPVQLTKDPKRGNIRRRMEVIAPVSLNYSFGVNVFAPGSTRQVDLEVKAFRDNTQGILELDAPAGWQVEPKSLGFNLAKTGDAARASFKVTSPPKAAATAIIVRATVGGKTYSTRRVEINYDHIPPILLQPTARLKAVSFDVAIRGKHVGYIPGAGDSVAECLEQMGYKVTKLNGIDITPRQLAGIDAVVIGVRAFNVRNDLKDKMPALFDFVEKGGNLIVQYNKPGALPGGKLGPLSVNIANERVTDENSPIKFLAPDHPSLNKPNKITMADFDGWVQERGLYFPNSWDKAFTPILGMNDPGAAQMNGSLLVAKHGKGHVVYTGLAWFRQLPDGVPGAYRIFANLVSLGKE